MYTYLFLRFLVKYAYQLSNNLHYRHISMEAFD